MFIVLRINYDSEIPQRRIFMTDCRQCRFLWTVLLHVKNNYLMINFNMHTYLQPTDKFEYSNKKTFLEVCREAF